MNIDFSNYKPLNGCHVFRSLISCYRNVFADSPWNEWLKCNVCGKYWGKKDKETLKSSGFRHCGQKLKLFWPHNTVHQDLIHEITESASCWLARESQKVIGFCWGYPIDLQLLEEKLEISFVSKLQEILGVDGGTVAYQDDIGVLPEHRGQKIAKKLFLHRHSDFIKKGLKTALVRTRELPEPSVTYNWFVEKLGYHIVKRYPDGDGRVILAQSLDIINELV